MRRSAAALLLALATAACAPPLPPPDTATLPPGVFGTKDQDVAAIQFAQYAFADASRTYGNPQAGAQAVLAMEYLAGVLSTNPRWSGIGSDTQQQFLQSRAALRQAVGIAPNAPSQAVVDRLITAANDLAAGDLAAARLTLANPVFTKGGEQTVEALGNLPYSQTANVATQTAAEQLFSPTGGPATVFQQ